ERHRSAARPSPDSYGNSEPNQRAGSAAADGSASWPLRRWTRDTTPITSTTTTSPATANSHGGSTNRDHSLPPPTAHAASSNSAATSTTDPCRLHDQTPQSASSSHSRVGPDRSYPSSRRPAPMNSRCASGTSSTPGTNPHPAGAYRWTTTRNGHCWGRPTLRKQTADPAP